MAARKPAAPPSSSKQDKPEKQGKPGGKTAAEPAPSRKGSAGMLTANADRMRQRLESAPAAAAARAGSVTLPAVTAPSLDKLVVTAPPLVPPTPTEVLARFVALRRAAATRRNRVEGEKVQAGDEVLLDTVGYSGGKLIPFSVHEGLRMVVEPQPMLPAFGEALAGLLVGKSARVDVVLPASYPVVSLAGQPASFLVDVREAVELKEPADGDREFLAAAGLGRTLDEAMGILAARIMVEREDAQIQEGVDRVLDEVATRLDVTLPEALVDEEIRRRWGEGEGRLVARKGFTAEEQEASLGTWLRDAGMRTEAARRLRLGLALGAICARDGVTLMEANVKPVLADAAVVLGMDVDAIRAALRKEKGAAQRVGDVLMHLVAVAHVMKHASVRFPQDG